MARRRRRSKKWVFWLFFLILLVVAGVVCYLVWDNYFKTDEPKEESGTSSVVEEKTEQKQEEKNEDSGEEIKKEEVVQYDGESPNSGEGITGAVTYAAVSGANLMIRLNIDQYLTSGSCNLVLYKDGASVYGDTANLVGSASTATCEGFNVPVSEIGSGNFQIEVRITSGEKNGIIKGEASI